MPLYFRAKKCYSVEPKKTISLNEEEKNIYICIYTQISEAGRPNFYIA